jgi:hypothetical protein
MPEPQEQTPDQARLERIEARLDKIADAQLRAEHALAEMRSTQTAAKREIVEELTEVMRSIQTELLRGFAAISEAQDARVRKLEANHAALDESATVRLRTLEQRLRQIEIRLGLQFPPTA